MVIQHNITALRAYNNWNTHHKQTAKALGRLSSGYRINSAADDPAGMAISERMKAQIASLKRQKMNAMDALSSIQISEGAQNEVSSMLLRMQELATESMNGILADSDRERLNEEYQQLMEEIDRINSQTNSNSVSLFGNQNNVSESALGEVPTILVGNNLEAYLEGLDAFLMEIATAAKEGDQEKLSLLGVADGGTDQEKVRNAVMAFTKQNGERLLNSSGGEAKESVRIILSGGDIKVNLLYSNTEDLGLKGTDISSAANAETALEALKKASSIVASQRSHYGALSNRLDHSINLMTTMEENMEEALSRIVDADMAKEMMAFVRGQALEQAAMFVMTYASHEPEQVLQMLKAV